MRLNIIVIGNGGPNKGAAAIAASTLALLSQIFPTAHVALLTEYPKEDSDRFGVDSYKSLVCRQNSLGDKAKEAIVLSLLVLYAVTKLARLNLGFLVVGKEKQRAVAVCAKADLIVFPVADTVSGTYDIFTTIGSLINILCLEALRRPVAILSAQVGPFKESLKGKSLFLLFKLLLNKVDLITVRDKSSFDVLKKMRVYHPEIHLVADVAFLLPAASEERAYDILRTENIRLRRPLVGISTSALIWRYGFRRFHTAAEKKQKYIQLMGNITDEIIEKLHANVVLFPNVFETDKSNDDRETARKIYTASRNKSKCAFIKGEYSPQELKSVIGLFDLFISTRMHPLIHAISMAVPALAIDYNLKQRELMKVVGQMDKVFSVNSLDEPDAVELMVSKILNTFDQRKEISKELAIKGQMLTHQALINGRALQELLERKALANMND